MASHQLYLLSAGLSRCVLSNQIYFALILYSYALHLRHDTYWKLPLSKSASANAHHQYEELEDELDAESDSDADPPLGESSQTLHSRTH